jgi:hypothetical protein
MKRTLLASAAFIAVCALSAQDGRSIGLELAVPVGDLSEATSFGVGVTGGYEIPVMDKVAAVVQVGYLFFPGKDINAGLVTIEGGNWSMIPAQVGGKYYLTGDKEGVYLAALLGIHHISYKIPATTTSVFGFAVMTPEQKFSETNFSFAPGIGYIVGENIDLGLRYQVVTTSGSSSSYLGLRAAYMF